jgi:hypothetical protein
MQQTLIRPKFRVVKLDGVLPHRITQFAPKTDENGKPMKSEKGRTYLKLIHRIEKRPAGFMVYFPKGHSEHVWTVEELIRKNFHRAPPLVDMMTGEEVETNQAIGMNSPRALPRSVEEAGEVDYNQPIDELIDAVMARDVATRDMATRERIRDTT